MKIKHLYKGWIDLTRLSLEFEKTFEKGSGKTLHKLIRALQETDLDSDILYVYEGPLKFYKIFILDVAEVLGFKLKFIGNKQVLIDNGHKIIFVSIEYYERNYNIKRGYRNLSVISDAK